MGIDVKNVFIQHYKFVGLEDHTEHSCGEGSKFRKERKKNMRRFVAAVWAFFQSPKQVKIAAHLTQAGYSPIHNPLHNQNVGRIGGEAVLLSYIFDSSDFQGVPRYFVSGYYRMVLTVGGVDLSCVEGPYVDLALEWAKNAAEKKQTALRKEREQMLAKIRT